MGADALPDRPEVRVAGEHDDSFFRHLFAVTHAEFAALPAELAASVVGHQYELRERQHRARHPTAVDQVVELDGRSVGRLSLAPIDGGTAIVVVDLAVLPDVQGRGVGSAVLAQVLAAADEERAAVELSVSADNAAVRLYLRLGFVASAHTENAAYLRMRRNPA